MVDFLLEQVMQVQLDVPRVVKQKLIVKDDEESEDFDLWAERANV